MSDRVAQPWTYSAEPLPHGAVRLIFEREVIHFRKEVIPDGQLAGMMGHLEIPATETIEFDLHPVEARALYDQLGHALSRFTAL